MNKYLTRYLKLIDHYQRNRSDNTFTEKHHITPKCLGGTNEPTNILKLPARAHIICHYLLHKAYPSNRALAKAFAMMTVNNKGQDRKFSSRLYEQSKIARSNALRGVPRPEWVKEKLRKPKADKTRYFGNTNGKGLKGFKHDQPRNEEHIQKIVDGRRWYDDERRTQCKDRSDAIRVHFISCGLSRKDFYQLYPTFGQSTIKKFLRGL